MTVLHAAQALTPTGWQGDLRLTITDGRFSSIEAASAPQPGDVRVAVLVPGLPKTRSGKIMRRILRKIASNEADQLGDISTLADPSVVELLKAKVK